MIKLVGLFILFFFTIFCSQINSKKPLTSKEVIVASPVQSMASINYTDFKKIQSLQEHSPKKVVVIFHKQGCDFCGRMKEETLRDPKIVKYLNDNYYVILFDALSKEDIMINTEIYRNIDSINDAYHELHQFFVDPHQENYYWPSIVFLNEKMKKITSYPGFQPKDRFLVILKSMNR